MFARRTDNSSPGRAPGGDRRPRRHARRSRRRCPDGRHAGAGTVGTATDALVQALEDPASRNRTSADALAAFTGGLDAVVPLLLRASESEVPSVRPVRRDVLFRIKRPAISRAVVPDLAAALHRDDPEVRCLAIHLLARLGPEGGAVVPALIGILLEPNQGLGAPQMRDPVYVASVCMGELAPATPFADEAVAALSEVLRPRGSKEAERRRLLASQVRPRYGGSSPRSHPGIEGER